jgi:hypothetical protein
LEEHGIDTDAAKALFVNESVLNIPDSVRDSVQRTLTSHYGLSAERVDKPSVREDIGACIDLEKFGVEPAMALKEYEETDWRATLDPYRVSHMRGSGYSFSRFVEACKAAVVYQRSEQRREEAKAERERIMSLSVAEWEELRQGVKWSQSGYAMDKEREILGVAGQMRKAAKTTQGLISIDEKKLGEAIRDKFMGFATTKAIQEGSTVKAPNYYDLILSSMTRRGELEVDDLLQPAPRESQAE